MSFTNLPSLEDIINLDIPYKEEFFKEVDIQSKEETITLNWNSGKHVIKRTVLTEPYPKKTPIIMCYHELYSQLGEIYQSYMMNTLSFDIWYEFIKDFKEEIEEYNESIQNEYYSKQIDLLLQKKRKLIQLFYIEYGFYFIEKLVKWKEFCDLKILREIKNYLRSWEFYSKKDLPFMIYHFQIKDWEYFFKYHYYMVKSGFDFEKMVQYVEIKLSLSIPPVQILSIPFSYFSFFSWKKVSLKNRNGKEIPLTENIIRYFFHETSHFEGSTFWFHNHSPYTLYYDGIEQKNDTLYLEHKNYRDSKKGFLECPSNLIPSFFKEKIKHFCIQKYPSFQDELWSFLNINSKSIYGKDLLKKCFHILGRLSKEYHFYQYHHSFFKKIEHQYLSIKHIHMMSKSILFPEFDYQTKKVQEEIKERWGQVFSFFKEELFSFLLNEEWNQSIMYIDMIPFYQLPSISLLRNIGKEDLFQVLNKKKTYLSFFQMDHILNIKPTEKREIILFNESKDKLEKYIKKCMDTN